MADLDGRSVRLVGHGPIRDSLSPSYLLGNWSAVFLQPDANNCSMHPSWSPHAIRNR
jgi:hypothetical protein